MLRFIDECISTFIFLNKIMVYLCVYFFFNRVSDKHSIHISHGADIDGVIFVESLYNLDTLISV